MKKFKIILSMIVILFSFKSMAITWGYLYIPTSNLAESRNLIAQMETNGIRTNPNSDFWDTMQSDFSGRNGGIVVATSAAAMYGADVRSGVMVVIALDSDFYSVPLTARYIRYFSPDSNRINESQRRLLRALMRQNEIAPYRHYITFLPVTPSMISVFAVFNNGRHQWQHNPFYVPERRAPSEYSLPDEYIGDPNPNELWQTLLENARMRAPFYLGLYLLGQVCYNWLNQDPPYYSDTRNLCSQYTTKVREYDMMDYANQHSNFYIATTL